MEAKRTRLEADPRPLVEYEQLRAKNIAERKQLEEESGLFDD